MTRIDLTPEEAHQLSSVCDENATHYGPGGTRDAWVQLAAKLRGQKTENRSQELTAIRTFGALLHRACGSIFATRERIRRTQSALNQLPAPAVFAEAVESIRLQVGDIERAAAVLEGQMRDMVKDAEEAAGWSAPPLPLFEP